LESLKKKKGNGKQKRKKGVENTSDPVRFLRPWNEPDGPREKSTASSFRREEINQAEEK
jgi:hypothetical protein